MNIYKPIYFPDAPYIAYIIFNGNNVDYDFNTENKKKLYSGMACTNKEARERRTFLGLDAPLNIVILNKVGQIIHLNLTHKYFVYKVSHMSFLTH